MADAAARSLEPMRLDEIERALVNPKDHDSLLIRESFARFGYVELLTLDERTGRLVAGHGRLDEIERAHEAGEDPPEGVEIADDGTWFVPVLRGWQSIDDDEAAAYLLTSNRSSEIGGWKQNELAGMLDDLAQRHDLTDLGWSDDYVSQLLDDLTGRNDSDSTATKQRMAEVELIPFRFGDISGNVTRAAYNAFSVRYEELRAQGHVLLADALIALVQ